MIVQQLSGNDMFDLGDGPMRPDPYIMETGRVDAAAYVSDERFAEERDLFGRIWLQMARVEELPKVGDWLVRRIDIRGVSALIVRGKDGRIRAFHNACSHRGMELAWEEKGRGGRFVCPYHGWLFGSQGELLNVPAAECFPHLNKEESGLTPIACEEYEGFIFLNLDPSPRQSLEEFLGPIGPRLKGLPFGQFTFGETVFHEVQCNWKLGIEAHSEGYHVPVRHIASFGKGMARGENPYMHYLSWEPAGPHRICSVPYNPSYRPPQDHLVQSFAATGASLTGRGTMEKHEGFGSHPSSNPTGSPFWHHDQYMLYPNMVIVAAHSGWWLSSYWPVSKNKSIRRATYFYKTPKRQRDRFIIRQDAIRTREIATEDSLALERQQAVLESGGMPVLQMGENEILLRHLLAVTTAATGRGTPAHLAAVAAE